MAVPDWFAEKKIFVVDCEMTGPNPMDDEIVEIAWVILRGGKISAPEYWYSELFDKETPMTNKARILTGLTDGDLESFGPLTDKLPLIVQVFYDAIVAGHNVEFDRGFINIAAASQALPTLNQQMLDTLALAYELIEDGPFERSLLGIAARYDIHVPNVGKLEELKEHRALFDTHVTAQLLCKFAEIAHATGRATNWDEFVHLARPFDWRPDMEQLALQRRHSGRVSPGLDTPARTLTSPA